MGLDAHVFCDCFEKGKVSTPPPYPELVFVSEDGDVQVHSQDGGVWAELAGWRHDACEHEMGTLLHYYIGNIALVAELRAELSRHPQQFPILLEKVVYNGIHAGDFLSLQEVAELRQEVERLVGYKCADKETEPYLEEFRRKMSDLVECALSVGKPIVF